MNTIAGFNTEEIKKAAEEIKRKKPDFELMINLYESIFIAQEKAKESISLPDFKISGEKLAIKLAEQFPLAAIQEFSIDCEVSEKLFIDICDILIATENELSETVRKISSLIKDKKIDLKKLFQTFIKEDESLFIEINEKQGVDKQVLAFIVYNALKPSLSSFSTMISVNLDKDTEWDKGYCPVCGSMPELSIFEENGKRFLICGFCGHKWSSKRMYCPFCENSDHETLQYYDIDDEEEYRVDVCNKCKKYIKTVDIKKTARIIYPPLELRSTPYIDLKFEKMGFKCGNAKE